MKKAIAIILFSLALEAGFLLQVAAPGPAAAELVARAAARSAAQATAQAGDARLSQGDLVAQGP